MLELQDLKNNLVQLTVIFLCTLSMTSTAQTINVTIDAGQQLKPISPFIYGKNNSTHQDPTKTDSAATWKRIRESGATILRENCGNENTKYNWRKKLTSCPDWYNIVAKSDWDREAKNIQQNLPDIQAMYGFQLLGYAAKSESYNWDAWGWYTSHGNKWLNSAQNLTGNGVPNPDDGRTALTEGNINLYLQEWPIDSSVAMLDHWFGSGGIGLKKGKMLYWAMDNEPDIWSSTHDDVMKTQIGAEEFMQRYFKAAKLARAKFPDIKICGPIACNEWYWYNWTGGSKIDGKSIPWTEFFIRRVAEEQKATGIRLLDVFTLHFYPGKGDKNDAVKNEEKLAQVHRIYFDTTYSFWGNGVYSVNGGYDPSIHKNYVFVRARKWLEKYMGTNHQVGLGVTETGLDDENPNLNMIWYASTLGEFMKNGVELFTPWSWKKGMWETLHLFAKYNKINYVQCESGGEEFVSAYPSMNNKTDSLTIVFVNKSRTSQKNVETTFKNCTVANGNHTKLELSNLPADPETFNSESSNAVKKGTATIQNNKLSLTLPAFSVTSVVLKITEVASTKKSITNIRTSILRKGDCMTILSEKSALFTLSIYNVMGKEVVNVKGTSTPGSYSVNLNSFNLSKGYYIVKLQANSTSVCDKFLIGK